MSHQIFQSLATPVPEFTPSEAADILGRRYSIEGVLKPLASERDQNFLVDSGGDRRYVLKFASAVEDHGVTEFQNEALIHIASTDPRFPVPRVVATPDGSHIFEEQAASGDVHRVRLLSWLEGTPLDETVGQANVAAQMGTALAQLGELLADFEHPAAGYGIAWDIHNAGRLRDLLAHVADVDLRTLCEQRIDRFRDVVAPRLEFLRRQVIHNDMNPSNVLVNGNDVSEVAGIIDFGDMVRSELVNDVAVAAAYLCRIESDPFAEVVKFLSAYTSVTPLTHDEIELLPDLILARHLTTVMITHWRSTMYPDNSEYILRSEKRARRMLETVAGMPMEGTVHRFLGACANVSAS